MDITWVIWCQMAFMYTSYMVIIPVVQRGGRGWIRAVLCWCWMAGNELYLNGCQACDVVIASLNLRNKFH